MDGRETEEGFSVSNHPPMKKKAVIPRHNMESKPDWSCLPVELLEKIVKGLTVIADYGRFRGVCRNWRCVAPKRPPWHLPCQIPWLMIPSVYNDYTEPWDRIYGGDFFSLCDNKMYHIDDFPPSVGTLVRCFGSVHGWLCFVDYNSLSISLWNPLTKTQLNPFPPITTAPGLALGVSRSGQEIYIWTAPSRFDGYEPYQRESLPCLFHVKFILSEIPSNNNNNNCIAMMIYSEDYRMAFCKPGDNKWSVIGSDDDTDVFDISDGIYHNGQIYCVHQDGRVTVWNADPYVPNKRTIAPIYPTSHPAKKYNRYLVEVSGELLMVIRCVLRLGDPRKHKTESFRVYRLVPTSEEWIRVTSLDDYTLFVGISSSFSISPKDLLPNRCKSNCIYFTDDNVPSPMKDWSAGHDIGIFHLEDESIEPLPCYEADRLFICPPPIWITPSLS